MSGRRLTEGEIVLARTVYKAEINYALPRVHNTKWRFFQPDDRAMAPNGNIYYAPSDPSYRRDFSAAGVGIHEQATFIHELGHVWQHQNGVNVIARGMFERDYDYLPMTASSRFSRYGIEEQAQILRDYFYLLNGHSNPKWPDISVYVAVIPFLP